MEASLKHITGPVAPVSRGLLATQTDSTLCALARRGHNGAYAALYARYQPAISRFVSQILGRGRAEDAADVTQEVFAAAFGALATRDREIPFKPWLYKIARNRSIDYLRAKRPVTADLDGELLPSAETPASQVEQREDLKLVVTAIESLPSRQREALVLRELGGLSHDEIAASLDTTVPSVKQLLTRGRASVNKQANLEGNRGLRKSLAAIYPPIPIAGGWSSLAGSLGLAGAGGAVTKAAAIALVIGALGGGAVGVERIASGSDSSNAVTVGSTSPGGHETSIGGPGTTDDDETSKDESRRSQKPDQRAATEDAVSGGDERNGSRDGDSGPSSGGRSGDSKTDSGGTQVTAPNVGGKVDETTGTVEETTGQIDNPVGETIPPVSETIDETLETIPNIGETVDNVGDTVGKAVETLPKVEVPETSLGL